MNEIYIAKIAVSSATYAIDRPYHYKVPKKMQDEALKGVRVLVPFGVGNKLVEGIILDLGKVQETKKIKEIWAVLDEIPVLDEKGIQLALWLRERYFSTVYQAVLTMLPTGLWYTLQDKYFLADGVNEEQILSIAGKSTDAKVVLEMIFASGGTIEFSQLLKNHDIKKARNTLNRLVRESVLVREIGFNRKVKDKTEKVAHLIVSPNTAMETMEKRKKKAPLQYNVVQFLCGIGSASVKEIAYFTGATMQTVKSLQKLGVLEVEEREVFRRALPDFGLLSPEIVLNEEQNVAYEGLVGLSRTNKAEVSLLYGVTGSGKTQIYIKMIQDVMQDGKTALVLVPEIALTAKLLELFVLYFKEKVAILHSALPATERYDEFKRIRSGKVKVVLGTRSAIFAPLKDLGMVILDEEHEPSYQSETRLCYHARDVAKYRCIQHKALLLLGSATPSIESMYAAKHGKYHLFTLKKRFNEKTLPFVTIVDMKEELRKGNQTGLSQTLRIKIEKTLEKGEQCILFLNRRGSGRFISCESCGNVPECERCSIHLHYHSKNERMMCHYCGYSIPVPWSCPECGERMHSIGYGTQKIEEDLNQQYPHVQVLRMDTDTVNMSRSHEVLLEKFERENIPILLGTQMVAKGLDFERVTLVGVIDADLSLYLNNFRASERTFSLLTQVVGRAGRGDNEGQAVIQTWTPEHEVIALAAKQDYDAFFESELIMRKARGYPPFRDLFRVIVSGADENTVLQVCMSISNSVARFAQKNEQQKESLSIFGPAPAGILKINDRYRYQLTINANNTKENRKWLAALLKAAQTDKKAKGVSIVIDINIME